MQAFLASQIAYPPIGEGGPDPSEVVDRGATVADIASQLRRLSPRLEQISRASEVAANGVTEPVEIEGGCGVGDVSLQAPELYLLAALADFTRGTLTLSGPTTGA